MKEKDQMKTAKFFILKRIINDGEFIDRSIQPYSFYEQKRNEYSFIIQAANGRILVVSEKPYTRKHSCKRAIETLQRALGSNLLVVDNTGTK